MGGTNNTQATSNIKPQEVWLAKFPFEDDLSVKKLRPVIVLTQTDNGLTVAGVIEESYLSVKVTGHGVRDDYDSIIVKWKEANLNKESVARASKTMELPRSEFVKKLGVADETDFHNILVKYISFIEANE